MYCGNCGTQNDDRAMFCRNCGAKLEGGVGGNQNQQWQQNIDYSYQNEIPEQISIQGKKKGKLKILIPAIAVVAVMLILVFSLTGRRGYKKTVENYVQGALDGDIEKVVSVIPEGYMEYYGVDRSTVIDTVEEALDDSGLYDLLDEDWEFSYEIGDAEDIKGAELQEIKDDCSDSGVKVSAAKSVDLKLTVTTEDGPESETVSIPLIKVGRKWYINIEEFMGLFY